MSSIVGMSDKTGQRLEMIEHLRQSVRRILTTPVGSCVLRREFGSHLFALIDSAGNAEGVQRLRAAAAQALMIWEPRLALERIEISVGADGAVRYVIIGTYNSEALEVSGTLTR